MANWRINVSALRERMGITQEDLAQRVWPHTREEQLSSRARTIRKWERGDRSPLGENKARLLVLYEEARAKGLSAPAEKPKRRGPKRVPIQPGVRFS